MGFHGSRLRVGLEGSINNQNLGGTEFDQPLPLPVLGAHGTWRFTDELLARVSLESLYIYLVDEKVIRELDIEGFIFDGIAALEWQFTKPFGVGLGYNLFYVWGNYGDNLARLRGRYTYQGLMLYGIVQF